MLFDNMQVYTPLEGSNASRLCGMQEFQATVNKTLLNNVWLQANPDVWGGLTVALHDTDLPEPWFSSRTTLKRAAYAYIWQLKTSDFLARHSQALWMENNRD